MGQIYFGDQAAKWVRFKSALTLERGESFAMAHRSSSACSASVGSFLARLGLNASRYLAKVAGLIGNSTKKSYFCSA